LCYDDDDVNNQCKISVNRYRVILSVLDPRKCEYLKDYSLDFEHAYMTTYLASLFNEKHFDTRGDAGNVHI